MRFMTLALTALNTEEKLALSGEMLLRGLGTVFMVLVILWIVLAIFGRVSGAKTGEPAGKAAPAPVPKQAKVEKKPEKKAEPAPAPAPQPAVQPASQDDRELIAVITAAIAAYQSASGRPNLPFRVVSFQRKTNASGWMGNAADNQ